MRKKAGKKLASVASRDTSYRSSRKPLVEQKSYPTRANEIPVSHLGGAALHKEEFSSDSERTIEGLELVSGPTIEEEVSQETKEMSGQNEDTLVKLLNLIVQRDENRFQREDARRAEEERKRKEEREESEMRWKAEEEERERRREAEEKCERGSRSPGKKLGWRK